MLKPKILRTLAVIALICAAIGICWANAARESEYAYESLYKAGKYSETIDAFKKILTDYPTSEAANEANFWIAMSYYNLDKKDDAFTYFQNQIKKAPGNRLTLEAALWIGQIYQDKKQYDLALAQFDKAVAAYPSFKLRAQFMIGNCYQEQKKYSEAIASLASAIDAASKAAVSNDDYYFKMMRIKLGEVYRECKDWDNGIAQYTQLIDDYPEDAGGFRLDLASCWQGKKDYEKAISIYDQVAENYPNEADIALLRIDDCLGEQRKFDEEITYLNKLYDDRPNLRNEVLFRRGIVRSDIKKEFAEAIDDFRQIISAYPDSWHVPYAKARIAGITLHGLRDITGARTLLLDFMSEYPDYGQMMFIKGDLGTCSYQEGNYLEAARLFEETLQYEDPSNYHAATLHIIADCYKRIGDIAKAKEVLKKLIDSYPGDCWAEPAAKEYAELCRSAGGDSQ